VCLNVAVIDQASTLRAECLALGVADWESVALHARRDTRKGNWGIARGGVAVSDAGAVEA